MSNTLSALSIREFREGLIKKEFSCKDVIDATYDRIHAIENDVHAFLTLTEESARAHANEVDKKIAHGADLAPLEGVPVALKDNMMTKGIRTTAGSKILDAYTAVYDAGVVQRLKKQGSILVGKTNLDEFAMGSSTENSAYGPTKNPHDLSRVPGGSSGGSAAAVASDECIFALGSDTGGSIRLPASLCGIVGLKPTYGSVSRHGLIAMASSLDQIGPMTRCVEDASMVFDAIKGPDPFDSSSACAQTKPVTPYLNASIKGLRIGVPEEYFIDGMDADVEREVRTAISHLKSLGATVIPINLPLSQYALSVYYVLQPAEVSANISRFDGIRYGYRTKDAKDLAEVYTHSRGGGLGQEVRRRIMLGTYVLAAGYYDAYYKKAQEVRSSVRRDFYNAFRLCDCIVSPASPVLPFLLGEKSADPLTMYLVDIFTVSANIAGIPGLVVPCGFVERQGHALPVGMQFLGRHFDEQTILRVGHQYEKSTEWHKRKPAISSVNT
ncbi:Asp-tRNA(Asn)/Glu-tRNA(Gln) amidotransferase subunit GatA [Candidatus Uhrbacteria bacterium]|nr:Asp-tRNA(Asn)/Glu-tRNA(Gln) amidotransferase subunit GatA [Candidatus Uhrbacteria bacterium]